MRKKQIQEKSSKNNEVSELARELIEAIKEVRAHLRGEIELKSTVFPVDKQIHIFPDGRLDTFNAALYVGISWQRMAVMRTKGIGPKFIKRGRIYYYKDDLDEWLKS